MNKYGAMARQHWARWLPHHLATIHDPDTFFTQMGQDAAAEIDRIREDLLSKAGPSVADQLTRAGLWTAVTQQAEEIVLPQVVLVDPEPETLLVEDEDLDDSGPYEPVAGLAMQVAVELNQDLSEESTTHAGNSPILPQRTDPPAT